MADQGNLPKWRQEPVHWRAGAASVRATAEQMKDAEASQQMLEVAAGYERMAQREEQATLGLGFSLLGSVLISSRCWVVS